METGRRPEWLSVTRYAQTYGVHRSTVYKWVTVGVVDIYRVGRLLRVRNEPPRRNLSLGVGSGEQPLAE